MSEHSPNLNLNLYSEADGEEKFRSFMEKLAGLGADSNMMLLDAAIKAQAEKLKKAALLDEAGKLPDSLLPEIGAEHIPFVASSLFQAAVGDASNVSDALENIGKVSADAYAHIENINNPHGVTAEKINAVPVSRTINGQPLSDDITLSPSDIGITGTNACCIVVGTTTAGHTLNDCDYLCDGVDDQEEIQAAETALAGSGGEILILNGTYNISSELFLGDPLMGNGCMISGVPSVNSHFTLRTVLNVTGSGKVTVGDGTTLKALRIQGELTNADNNSGNYIRLIQCSSNNEFSCKINNGLVYQCSGLFRPTEFNNSVCYGHQGHVWPWSGQHSLITGVHTWAEYGPLTISCYNISNCVISGNLVFGITVSDSTDNLIIGNKIIRDGESSFDGLSLLRASRNIIVGNTVYKGAGDPAEYTTGETTIYLSAGSTNNLIASNLILGRDYRNNGGSGNIFVNNKYN